MGPGTESFASALLAGFAWLCVFAFSAVSSAAILASALWAMLG